MINLSQAKELVKYLEADEQDAADALIASIVAKANQSMFIEIGKLTREVHNSILDFQLNPRINLFATIEIPSAKERLSYVLEKTETAVNRTMAAVETITPLAKNLQSSLFEVNEEVKQIIQGEINLVSLQSTHEEINQLLGKIDADGNTLEQQLSEILIAQEFQDLTGQVISQIINLFKDIEVHLLQILTSFDAPVHDPVDLKESGLKAEGPIIGETQKAQKQVLESQDEVDELLKSLGF